MAPVPLIEKRAWRVAGLIVVIAFGAALLVHVIVLERFPNSGDEHAYLWQATAFAQGVITAPSPQPQEAFRVNQIGDVNGRRFSKYPPGWPLLLSIGAYLGVSGVVNPLLAALALAGIYRLGCSWVDPRAAVWGAVFVLCTPFFLLNAGSYHSHPSCLFALTALALALTWAAERDATMAMLLAGASFGLAVLIRPFTGLLIGMPLLVAFAPVVLARGRRFARLAAFAVGGVPFAAFLALVNVSVTGSWFRLAWSYYDPSETLGFTAYGHSVMQGIKTTIRLLAEGVLYTSFVGAVVLIIAWGQRFATRPLVWVLLIAPVIGHLFWWSHGGNRYGPRFYFEALLPFTILTGAGLERIAGRKWFRAASAAASAVCTATLVSLFIHSHRQVHARRDVYRVVERAGIRHAIVLLTTASSDMVRIDLTRNPPDFQRADVLYGLSRGPLDQEVSRAYPDRAIYLYRWTPDGGMLTSLRP